jgi:hypothetical protein
MWRTFLCAFPASSRRLRSNGVLLLTILLGASCTAASCQSSRLDTSQAAAAAGASSNKRLEDFFTRRADLIFRDSVASPNIQVYADPHGGFVVADGGQAQIRVYTDDAELAWAAGRSGSGPQEFRQLSAAVRAPWGEILGLDSSGKLSVFDASGNFVRTVSTGLVPSFDGWLLTDSTMLISGRREGDPASPLLHVWNLRRDLITGSFFQVPPHDPAYDEAYRFSGWADAVRLGGDSVAVVFSLADSLYLYRTSGEPLGKFPLPLEHFSRVRQPGPRDGSPDAEVEWRNSYTRISHIFRSPDGSIYVQYFQLNRLEPVWGLTRFFFQDGRLIKAFELVDTPRLLAISPRDSLFYFLSDDLMENSKWSVAQLSR